MGLECVVYLSRSVPGCKDLAVSFLWRWVYLLVELLDLDQINDISRIARLRSYDVDGPAEAVCVCML